MTRTAIILLLFASCAPASAKAAIIYREIFPNNGGSNQDLSFDGWQIHFDSDAEQISTGGNSPTVSQPNNTDPGVNSFPSNAPPVAGYASIAATVNTNYLFWTSEYTVDRTADSVTSISWWQANTSSEASSQAAVRIGTQWYASTDTFSNPAAANFNSAYQRTLDFTTATWQLLDFVPGTSLALGAATTLPAGNLIAFGWYVDSSEGARLRMDTFEINAVPVPEPSTGLLLTAAGFLLLSRRRSRRNRLPSCG
jgi:hypothetical protein